MIHVKGQLNKSYNFYLSKQKVIKKARFIAGCMCLFRCALCSAGSLLFREIQYFSRQGLPPMYF